jgi:hypothetical protein
MPNAGSGRVSRRNFIHRSVAATTVVATAQVGAAGLMC